MTEADHGAEQFFGELDRVGIDIHAEAEVADEAARREADQSLRARELVEAMKDRPLVERLALLWGGDEGIEAFVEGSRYTPDTLHQFTSGAQVPSNKTIQRLARLAGFSGEGEVAASLMIAATPARNALKEAHIQAKPQSSGTA